MLSVLGLPIFSQDLWSGHRYSGAENISKQLETLKTQSFTKSFPEVMVESVTGSRDLRGLMGRSLETKVLDLHPGEKSTRQRVELAYKI